MPDGRWVLLPESVRRTPWQPFVIPGTRLLPAHPHCVHCPPPTLFPLTRKAALRTLYGQHVYWRMLPGETEPVLAAARKDA